MSDVRNRTAAAGNRRLNGKTYIKCIDDFWYAFEVDWMRNRVLSIGKDSTCGFRYITDLSDAGIKYVATSSPDRKAAYKKAARRGNYCGEL